MIIYSAIMKVFLEVFELEVVLAEFGYQYKYQDL